MPESVDRRRSPRIETQLVIALGGYRDFRLTLHSRPLDEGELFHEKARTGSGRVIERYIRFDGKNLREIDPRSGAESLYPSKQAFRPDERWPFVFHHIFV